MVRGATRISSPQGLTHPGVIEATPGAWLKFPSTVSAPSPSDRLTLCSLRVSRNDTVRAARAGRRQPAFELWSIIIGNPPPVPGVHARNSPNVSELTSLAESHACFRGIERPLAEDNDGADVVAYVLRPRFFYQYDPNMVSVALKMPVPRDVVFVVYARLADEATLEPGDPIGVITHWGFVEVDNANPKLPVNFASRYRVRLW